LLNIRGSTIENKIVPVFPQHPSTQDNQRIKALLHATWNEAINPEAPVTEYHISGLRGREEANSLEEEKPHLPGKHAAYQNVLDGLFFLITFT
jgi:hypothetical protein